MLAKSMSEKCPFAYRERTSTSVMCQKIAEMPGVKWKFCAHQYFCAISGRWEATDNPKTCIYRQQQSSV